MSDGALHTIGEFARLTGLTEKALRLYDGKGLARPAEVDEATGYRLYSPDQVDDGRLVAMLRAIDMPLADIRDVLEAEPRDRSAAVGRYWYRIERDLDDHRATVRALRSMSEEKGHGMSHATEAIEAGRADGGFAAVAKLAAVDDLTEAAHAYGEAMRTAYWEDKDVPLVTAVAFAGASRLLAAAETAHADAAHEARSAAKGLMYDLASFTWVGWDEPGIDLAPTDAASGLAAARSNLAMAHSLDKGDLPVARAHWMLGGHLLTAGRHAEAERHFHLAGAAADRAGAEAEVLLAEAFAVMARLAGGDRAGEEELDAAVKRLGAAEGGEMFVAQVETARGVLGL